MRLPLPIVYHMALDSYSAGHCVAVCWARHFTFIHLVPPTRLKAWKTGKLDVMLGGGGGGE